jgi:hypothetical protein
MPLTEEQILELVKTRLISETFNIGQNLQEWFFTLHTLKIA